MTRETLKELLVEFANAAYWYGEDTGDYDHVDIFRQNKYDTKNEIDPYGFKDAESTLWELIDGGQDGDE